MYILIPYSDNCDKIKISFQLLNLITNLNKYSNYYILYNISLDILFYLELVVR